MALKDKQPEVPDITRQQSRALEFFTNRYALTRLFLRYLNLDPTPERILFFCGDGGNGKSLLLRFLREYCCKRLDRDIWAWIDGADDVTFRQRLMQSESTEPVGVAMLDFGMQPVGENRPQEPFSALLMLRRQLGEFRVRFPLFDFACVTYLQKTDQLTDERLKNLFPADEMDMVKEIVGALSNNAYVALAAAALKLFNNHLKEHYTIYKHKRGLSEESIMAIGRLDPYRELPRELPALFAEDLNAAMGQPSTPSRVVLFLDTYEAFWGHERNLVGTPPGFYRDEWVRCLLRSLDLDRGIITVLAGRDRPRWAKASREPIDDSAVELKDVDYLSTVDALAYLDRVRVEHRGEQIGIPAGPLRDQLVVYASAGPDMVHPFYLGLCAEVVLAAAIQGKTLELRDFDEHMEESRKGAELTQRLLSYVDDELKNAIVALSACRTFDRELYYYLGSACRFYATDARWQALTSFSFVLPAGQRGEGWYRIHELLRRALHRERDEQVREAHDVLEQEYRRRADEGDESARVEAIYHLTRVEHTKGITDWLSAVDENLALGRLDRSRLLAALLPELEPLTEQERLSCAYRTALVDIGLGYWEHAEQTARNLPERSVHALMIRAELSFCRSQFKEAEELTRRALASCRPDERLPIMYRLAEIQLYRGRLREVQRIAQGALDENGIGSNWNELAKWRNIRGEATFFLGDVEAAAGWYRSAEECLHREGARVDHVTWGDVEANIGFTARTLGKWDTATAAYELSLQILKDCGYARGVLVARYGLAETLVDEGELDQAESELGEAQRIASNLGERVIAAKLRHSQGKRYLKLGELAQADVSVRGAINAFRSCGTPYDVAHSLLTYARVQHSLQHGRGEIEAASEARQLIRQGEFGLLNRLYPEYVLDVQARMHSAVLAYSAGDALGAPWEGKRPSESERRSFDTLPPRENWERGATTDDTALLLLVMRYLAEHGLNIRQDRFLEMLAHEFPRMRGVGPTTSQAVARFLHDGSVRTERGATNGAALRALPIGWATPLAARALRHELTVHLSETTHGAPDAIAGACLVAELASWALDGATTDVLFEVAVNEAEELVAAGLASQELTGAIVSVKNAIWQPPADGIGMETLGTVMAVLHVLRQELGLAESLRYAVSLGGDTDTTAAIAGGLLGCRFDDASDQIPWMGLVRQPASTALRQLVSDIVQLRDSCDV